MRKDINISVSPEAASDENLLKRKIAEKLMIPVKDVSFVKLLRRSVDARFQGIKINISAEVFFNEPAPPAEVIVAEYPDVKNREPVIIIGCGPAGMFAALRLTELGYKPILLERGKDVRSRRRDIALLSREHIVDPDSNYCFGEGGAGTFSDGKLYTRSTKKGDVKKILRTFVAHGANGNILIDSHPHIGTNKLPGVVEAIRQSVLNAGGEIHFNSKVVDFDIRGNEIRRVITGGGDKFEAKAVILATGHSARDIFELLGRKKILVEAKPFAVGVRVEHPQPLIDSIQYHLGHGQGRGEYLPAAAYNLAHQVKGRGVFSFCMCPGGFIVPASTAPGELVLNGMSPSRRDSRFANSGMVVSVEKDDFAPFVDYGEFSGLMLQKEMEKMAFEAGGHSQTAPAQRLVDFCNRKLSAGLPECSYVPGIKSAALHELLPKGISERLQEGFKFFGKKMHGFLTNEAVILGVETRTSSPVRIPRDKRSLQHLQVKNLFPCGEGAGYSGGIVSSALDGELCAEAAVKIMK